MMKVKYQSIPFFKMTPVELHKTAGVLILKINAITGWTIPDQEMLDLFADQFIKKIQESYPNFNSDEIEFAFRNYGTTVQDWGKQMNLALIDEVMFPYKAKRMELSQVEERLAPDPKGLLPEAKEDMSDKAMDDWYRDLIRKIGNMENYPVDFVPLQVYTWLDKKGLITETDEEKRQFVVKAVEYRHAQLRESVAIKPLESNQNLLAAFNRMINPPAGEKRVLKGAEAERVRTIAKKMLLLERIKKMAQTTEEPKIKPD